ncbi:hypothetical protein GCK72_018136 [Caenorhabditis remanei]|uniref:Uncharacterized protein n=1 Tax=Caenorhabditis remanei TaxID=31234 RepID=A0A6A5GAK6_CAERE|nr:hypothetical protein GCK72_018136 [Caenorhabditis remanei]KAF1751582.1 hypothetical protein GCK72_018136 [Caenorhabditis remanei]
MEKNSGNPSATTSTNSNTNDISQTIRQTQSDFGKTPEEGKKVREAMMKALNCIRELGVQRPDDPMTFLSEFMLMEDPKLSPYFNSNNLNQKLHKSSYYASSYIKKGIEELLKKETEEDPAIFLSNYFLSQKESFEKKMAEQKSLSNKNDVSKTVRQTQSDFGKTPEEGKKVREAMMKALNCIRELGVQRPDDPMTFLSEFILEVEKNSGNPSATTSTNSNTNDISQTIRQTHSEFGETPEEKKKVREAMMRALNSVRELNVQRPDDPMTFLSEFMLMEDPKLSSCSDWDNSNRKPHKSSHCAKSYIQPAIEELLKQKTEEDPAIFLSNYFLSQKESFDGKMAG